MHRDVLMGHLLPAALLATALVSPLAAFAADPAGRYTVEGRNPGNGSGYSGTAEIVRTGDTFRVTWLISGQRYVGTAIGNDQFFTVSYRSGNETGLALYGETGDGWQGTWTYAGATKLGTERWTRR